MYSITLQNKNGRILREYRGIDLPMDIDKSLDLIWLGMSSACTIGRITVTDEITMREVASKVFVANK